MQAGSLAGGDVRAFTSRIVVAGVERAHKDWSVSRDLIGDLPEQVAAVSGIKQATGSVTWAEVPDVSDGAVTPWNSASGWLPKPGDPVQILVSDGVSEWVQFTGVIDETSGTVGGLPQSTIVDVIDRLNKPVAFEALLRVMPPLTLGAPEYRGIGLTAQYIADRAMRSCGFYATPRTEGNIALSVPAQTSMWPGTSGVLNLGGSESGTGSHALNSKAPWGWSVGNFNCSYTPRLNKPGTDAVQLTILVAPDHAGTTTFDVYYGATKLRLWINTGRSAVAMLDGVELGRLSLGADTIVTLLVDAGTWTIRRASGLQVSGAVTMPATVMDTVGLVGDTASRVAGFQVSHPTTTAQRFASLDHVPSATVESSYLTGIADALPAVDTTAIDVMEQISKATLTPFWLDETGILRAVGSWELRNQTPAQTVTTLDDITSLAWADSLLGQRSNVYVSYDALAITKSRWPNITMHQGSGETMESGQSKEEFIEPPTDEDWIQLDTSLETAGVDPDKFNSAWGSFGGGVYKDNTSGATTSAGDYVTTDLALVKGDTYKLNITVGSLPANTKALLKTKDLSTFHVDKREFNLPVLRGYAKVQRTDAKVTSTYVGPASAPALTHEAGPWNSRTDDTTVVQRIADFIGARTYTPQPLITGLQVTYDPRRQLGDVITIDSPNLMGVTIHALVVGVRNSAGGGYSQSLTVRIIDAASTYTTYAEFEQAHSDSLTYEQWRLLFPDTATYDTFNDDPLTGATL